MQNFVKRLTRRMWDLPANVPSAQQQFLAGKEHQKFKWLFKFVKRQILFLILGKCCGLTKEVPKITVFHRKILWINWAAPSIGDSLMDLSARRLLGSRHIILLTQRKNYEIYLKDPTFVGVYFCREDLVKDYGRHFFDLVICDSYSPRVLMQKLYVAPFTDFAGLYGFLNGFELHRTYFAFARLSQLVGKSATPIEIRPVLFETKGISNSGVRRVAVAIGGEWSFRTYPHWHPVVEDLVRNSYEVVLVGSPNGLDLANRLAQDFDGIENTVGKLTLREVVREIANCDFFIGADGGLWHIACAVGTPSVVMFADCQIFDSEGKRVTRETADIVCQTLYHSSAVENIPSEEIVVAFRQLEGRVFDSDISY